MRYAFLAILSLFCASCTHGNVRGNPVAPEYQRLNELSDVRSVTQSGKNNSFIRRDGKNSGMEYVERVLDDTSCEEYWDRLWPMAKDGDGDAIYQLFSLVASGPHMNRICPPGSACDLVSTLRDVVILSIYARISIDDPLKATQLNLFDMFGFRESARGRKLMECAQREGECVDIAVSLGLVPSFEDYSRQIDALMAQGLKGKCVKAPLSE